MRTKTKQEKKMIGVMRPPQILEDKENEGGGKGGSRRWMWTIFKPRGLPLRSVPFLKKWQKEMKSDEPHFRFGNIATQGAKLINQDVL